MDEWGYKRLSFFLATSAISLTIGIIAAQIVQPGSPGLLGDGIAEDYEVADSVPIMDTLVNIIPNNPIESMANMEMLQIISFAIFVGLAMAMLGKKSRNSQSILCTS